MANFDMLYGSMGSNTFGTVFLIHRRTDSESVNERLRSKAVREVQKIQRSYMLIRQPRNKNNDKSKDYFLRKSLIRSNHRVSSIHTTGKDWPRRDVVASYW
jgi:hypothetical protein